LQPKLDFLQPKLFPPFSCALYLQTNCLRQKSQSFERNISYIFYLHPSQKDRNIASIKIHDEAF
jgi:hypothetical protein